MQKSTQSRSVIQSTTDNYQIIRKTADIFYSQSPHDYVMVISNLASIEMQSINLCLTHNNHHNLWSVTGKIQIKTEKIHNEVLYICINAVM